MGRILNIHGVDDVRLDPTRARVAGNSDVVVKIKACGICGSDLSYIKIGRHHRRPEGGVTPIGHEAAGEVVTSATVKDTFVGQHVVINPDEHAELYRQRRAGGRVFRAVAGARCQGRRQPAADRRMICRTKSPLWPNRWRWRCMASTARMPSRATRWWCSAADRSASMVLWLVDRGVKM